MSYGCLSSNPLKRNGTSQKQRLLDALLPSYAPVDERSMKDLLEYVHKITTEYQYHYFNSATGQVDIDGSWQDFFDLANSDWDTFDFESFIANLKKTSETKPHVALLVAFLYMFRIAQDDLNTLTQRHLDFYYSKVLRVERKKAIPDQVSVILELAKHIEKALIRKNTEFKAGKDRTGVERVYRASRETAITKATISEMRAVFANINNAFTGLPVDPQNKNKIYASAIANSGDGKGADIESEQGDWRTFGRPEFPGMSASPASTAADRAYGDIGFAIASPVLFLAEGRRAITISVETYHSFTFPGTNALVDGTIVLKGHWNIFVSGEEGWFEPSEVYTTVSGKTLKITAIIAKDQPAVIAYDEETLSDPFDTDYPVMKVLLDQDSAHYLTTYQFLKNKRPKSVKVSTDVEGVRELVLQNEEGVLDPSKPFYPFGSRPVVGSKFLIGSWEVYQKKLTRLEFIYRFKGLPAESFASYYTEYSAYYSAKNTQFQVIHDVLERREWKRIGSNRWLFRESDGTDLSNGTAANSIETDGSKMPVLNTHLLDDIGPVPDLETFEAYDVNSQHGFSRWSLKKAFGHQEYSTVFATQAINLANGTEGAAIPNPPYIPEIEEFSINYTSEVELVNGTQTDQVFHLWPFGVEPISAAGNFRLIPKYKYEAQLYLGIDGLEPRQNLSLHVQVAEGSANPLALKQDVVWSFLKGDEWVDLDEEKQILYEETNGLLKSGIIVFDIPVDADDKHHVLPAGKHWLRAAVAEDSDAVCDLIDVLAQAVPLVFKDNNNDPDHFADGITDGSIKKLVDSDSSVKKITQPFSSFGGKKSEQDTEFYKRVSERLRHKNRAITIWDFERLVLQEFPSVYKVKCVNHARFGGTLADYSEIAPGHITLIVVPDVTNKNASDPLRPMTSLSLLDDIETFLAKIMQPCPVLHVRNPVYESIRVEFNVKFRPGIDTGIYSVKLDKEIVRYLAPWAFRCSDDIAFGGRVHKSQVINFIEERSYVDYVTCFRMYHIVPDDPDNNPNKDVDVAVATTQVSILGSVPEHDVHVIPATAEGCDCPDNIIVKSADLITSDCNC